MLSLCRGRQNNRSQPSSPFCFCIVSQMRKATNLFESRQSRIIWLTAGVPIKSINHYSQVHDSHGSHIPVLLDFSTICFQRAGAQDWILIRLSMFWIISSVSYCLRDSLSFHGINNVWENECKGKLEGCIGCTLRHLYCAARLFWRWGARIDSMWVNPVSESELSTCIRFSSSLSFEAATSEVASGISTAIRSRFNSPLPE